MSLLIEAAVILGWIAVLARHRGLRHLIRDAPRSSVIVLGMAWTGWIAVQLRTDLTHYFPLVAWQMYGERRPGPEVLGARVEGEGCDGRRFLLAPGELLPHRGVPNRIRDQYASAAAARTASDSAIRFERLDALLRVVGRRHNAAAPAIRACAVDLLFWRIPAGEVGRSPIPAPIPVRRVPID